MSNYILLIPGITWLVAHLLKMVIRLLDPKFDRAFLMSSGGMPSVHSAFMTSLATAVAYREGVLSSLFAVTLCMSAIVMYDAMNIRFEGGKHAAILNKIQHDSEHRLNEFLGHTPLQVLCGGVFGVVGGTVLYFI